jgi:hypothetical protein
MFRLRGDRASLLAALVAHWSEQQLAIPVSPRGTRPVSPLQKEGVSWLGTTLSP